MGWNGGAWRDKRMEFIIGKGKGKGKEMVAVVIKDIRGIGK